MEEKHKVMLRRVKMQKGPTTTQSSFGRKGMCCALVLGRQDRCWIDDQSTAADSWQPLANLMEQEGFHLSYGELETRMEMETDNLCLSALDGWCEHLTETGKRRVYSPLFLQYLTVSRYLPNYGKMMSILHLTLPTCRLLVHPVANIKKELQLNTNNNQSNRASSSVTLILIGEAWIYHVKARTTMSHRGF